MGISRTHRRRALWIRALPVALALVLLVTGCAGIEPYEPRDHREEGPEKGLFTGSGGEFVIFRKADEPEKSADASDDLFEETQDWLICDQDWEVPAQRAFSKPQTGDPNEPAASALGSPSSAASSQPARRISEPDLALLAYDWARNQRKPASEDRDRSEEPVDAALATMFQPEG